MRAHLHNDGRVLAKLQLRDKVVRLTAELDAIVDRHGPTNVEINLERCPISMV